MRNFQMMYFNQSWSQKGNYQEVFPIPTQKINKQRKHNNSPLSVSFLPSDNILIFFSGRISEKETHTHQKMFIRLQNYFHWRPVPSTTQTRLINLPGPVTLLYCDYTNGWSRCHKLQLSKCFKFGTHFIATQLRYYRYIDHLLQLNIMHYTSC